MYSPMHHDAIMAVHARPDSDYWVPADLLYTSPVPAPKHTRPRHTPHRAILATQFKPRTPTMRGC
jgi:hypothetical protein